MAVIHTETWTGTDGAGWPAQWTSWTHNPSNASGSNTIQGNEGRTTIASSSGYNGRFALLDGSSEGDFDWLISEAADDGNAEQYIKIFYHCTTNLSSGEPGSGFCIEINLRDNVVDVKVLNSSGGNDNTAASVSSAGISDTARYWFRIHREADNHKVRWWADGGSEPGTWQIDVNWGSSTPSGRFLLGTVAPGGSTRSVDWDGLSIDDLTGGGSVEAAPVAAAVAVTAGTIAPVGHADAAPTSATVAVTATVIDSSGTSSPAPVSAAVTVTAGVVDPVGHAETSPVAAVVAVAAGVLDPVGHANPAPVSASVAVAATAIAASSEATAAPVPATVTVTAGTLDPVGHAAAAPVTATVAVTATVVDAVATADPAPVAASVSVAASVIAASSAVNAAPVPATIAVTASTVSPVGHATTQPVAGIVAVTAGVLDPVGHTEAAPVAALIAVTAAVMAASVGSGTVLSLATAITSPTATTTITTATATTAVAAMSAATTLTPGD